MRALGSFAPRIVERGVRAGDARHREVANPFCISQFAPRLVKLTTSQVERRLRAKAKRRHQI
jgi:hypothetical protein